MKTKRIFYRNYNTGETVWKLPDGAVIFPPPPKPETPKPAKISPFTFDAVPLSAEDSEGDSVPIGGGGSGGGGGGGGKGEYGARLRGGSGGDDLEALAQSIGSLTAFDFRVPSDADERYNTGYAGYEYEDDVSGENYDDDY